MLVVKPDPKNENNDVKALNAFLDGEPCGYVRFYHKGYMLSILYPSKYRSVGLSLLHPGKKEQNRRLVGSRCYSEVPPTAFQAIGH